MKREDYKKIANETIRICKEKKYLMDNKKIILEEMKMMETIAYSPKELERKLGETIHTIQSVTKENPSRKEHRITVEEMDTLVAATKFLEIGECPVVLNFANPYVPGGKFLEGTIAQEESICQRTTLYASLTSNTAKNMYEYNQIASSPLYTDYMLYSPNVYLIRDEAYELIPPRNVFSVITAAAVSITHAAMNEPQYNIDQAMLERIRKILTIAILHKKRTIILGAWGCGAYGNSPDSVSRYFEQVLIREGFLNFFDHVMFAIKDTTKDKKNLRTFQNVFLQTEGQEKDTKVQLFRYPFPSCLIGDGSLEPEIYLGYCEGLLSDGRPFLAELTKNPETEEHSITFVMSAKKLLNEEETSFSMNETIEPMEATLERTLYTLILEDVSYVKVIDDMTLLHSIIKYLTKEGVIAWTGAMCNSFAMTFVDENENEMLAVNVSLEVRDTVVAKTDLNFEPYKKTNHKSQEKKKFRVVKGGLQKK